MMSDCKHGSIPSHCPYCRIAELKATIAERDAQLKFIRIGYEVLVQTGERHALDAALEKNDE